MKRWVFTTLVLTEDQERVPLVAPYTNPSDPTAPKMNVYSNDTVDRCVCLCAFPNLSDVSEDPNVFVFPDVPLGVAWSSIPQADRNTIAAKIRAFGFAFNPHATMTIKAVIELAVHEVQPGVNVETQDIYDPYG